ncbi:hypothetical protein GCM10009718_19980 [Isoptericola halotolerans]|uniref:Lipoprotein n=1 Tax=Isoptericola halotolerans TaxID=300560 RepID=A0ABX2A8W8_9MICO|nr:hypothetical protein [Isoptericola halotolerans]NOV98418.1 hypothetical protein [Isoptericola halotolerans]
MRARSAAAAALPLVLLVTACADPNSVAVTDVSASPAVETHTPAESVTPRATCNGYYVGRSHSLDRKIRKWTTAVGEPATPEATAEISIIRDRLAAQIHDAEVGPAAILRGVHEPFAAWLDGGTADPAEIVEAADAVRRMCDEMGVDF